jgi:tricorn protease
MMLGRFAAAVAAVLCAALTMTSVAVAAEGYYRFPALVGDVVLFTAEGDLWSMPLAGGRASRLTTHQAKETNAVASPDDQWLAFAAAYDGPVEVYVMPLSGGPPRRVTFEGTRSVPVGWAPAGEVLYVSQNPIGPGGQQIITAVDPVSLNRHPLPLADANDAAVAPDSRTLYFTRFGLAASNDNAKLYRGGMLSRLWRFDLDRTVEAEPLGNDGAAEERINDRRPMPWRDRIYFISDRDGRDNLWSMAAHGGDRRQLTRHADFDIRTASLHDGRIVYQLGADLHVYDIVTAQDRRLAIDLVSDFDQKRRHLVKQPLDFFESAAFAPNGERVAVTARGRIALMGVGPMRRIDVATPPHGRASAAVVSPDGLWVYAISEEIAAGEDAGAPQIWRFAGDGSAHRQQLTRDDAGHRTKLWLSPDGKWLAHGARDGRLFLLDIDKGGNELIDTADYADLQAVVWSPDSRHLAFVRSDSNVERGQLFLYEPASRTKARLTTDRYEVRAPAFASDGKWLYFLSDRQFKSRNRSPWGDRNMGPFFDRRTRIYALALRPGLRFPFQPKDEFTPVEPAKEPAKPAGDVEKNPEPLPVQWEGLADRLYEVPLDPGNYDALETDGKRLYVLDEAGEDGRKTLKTLEIGDQPAKPQDFLVDVRQFALSADRKKLFLRRWAADNRVGDMLIVPAGVKAPADLAKVPTEIGKATSQLGRATGDFSKMMDELAKIMVQASD